MAEQAGATELEVFVPAAPNDRAARTEVDVYLAAWRVKTGGSTELLSNG